MFLSEILLDASFCYQQQIEDDYSLHRVIYSFFPRSETSVRHLYADCGPTPAGRKVLLLSPSEPKLPANVTSSTKIIGEKFWDYPNYRFEVTLNPVKKNFKTKKREAIIGQVNLLEWFLAQAPKWGFEADRNTLEVAVHNTKIFTKSSGVCRFNNVFFRGKLQVTDREKFRQSAQSGIGHGKAFGFGLLRLQIINHQ
ncbi:MAG: type I-E CRISPR-associated protein Cas6/Cse3/CasE [Victivallaceae bacterium]